MDTLLNDVDFSIANLDDILIKRESREQHGKYVKKVFEKIKQYGLKLWINVNKKKKVFGTDYRWIKQKARHV